MLDTDVDSFFDVTVPDALVDDDADGGFGYVVDDACISVVDFVGHAVKLVSLSCVRALAAR